MHFLLSRSVRSPQRDSMSLLNSARVIWPDRGFVRSSAHICQRGSCHIVMLIYNVMRYGIEINYHRIMMLCTACSLLRSVKLHQHRNGKLFAVNRCSSSGCYVCCIANCATDSRIETFGALAWGNNPCRIEKILHFPFLATKSMAGSDTSVTEMVNATANSLTSILMTMF